MSSPLVPRDAATIMLVRDMSDGAGSTGMQVLMLRRNPRSGWVAGAHLFPGGAVDPADGGADIARYCAGREDAEASRILGIGLGGRSFFVAAVRECFEEAGILLALRGGEPLSFAEAEVARRFGEHRRRLNSGEARLVDICASEGLALDLDRVAYFSHWITPEGAPRRYDTRFFVGVVPEGQEALHDDSEVVASTWIEPAAALERHRAGELDLMFPTMKNLEAIGRFDRAGELMAAAAAAEVPAILPRITVEGEGVRIVLPGDEGYEDATGLPPGVPFPDRPQPIHPPAPPKRVGAGDGGLGRPGGFTRG
ncbi:MAG TPA: NUDIX domain-containing protein [Acidimicrobiales bacterium]|nr:NUDIX domain-containing protein [Acidimicrobiales bacterium]